MLHAVFVVVYLGVKVVVSFMSGNGCVCVEAKRGDYMSTSTCPCMYVCMYVCMRVNMFYLD